ncbi:MAG: glycine cleavage system protein GcvH [Proteobacteria bacterium]|nr:MAG: glycine cleavage system protein GcvH [Pseudomonadota bacterium]QKK11279.1 MAG: glycine cleavage system protein GcvH [Pseudomonadota bacterium]
MSNVPAELKYAKSHEWVRDNGDGTVTVGISDHAQEQLGDLVFVELPEIGRAVKAGEECVVIESVKAAADVYSPLAGEVCEVNANLEGAPELINGDAYGDGWIFRLTGVAAGDLAGLMDADAYSAQLAAEE